MRKSLLLMKRFWIFLIPHELWDERNPPWLNTKIKSLIHDKIKTYKVLRKNIENNQCSWETKVSAKLFKMHDWLNT